MGAQLSTRFLSTLLLLAGLGLSGCVTTDATEAAKDKVHRPYAQSDAGQATQLLLVVGAGPFYLVHAPRARGAPPLVVEVELMKPGVDLHALYQNDRRVTGEAVYSVIPEAFAVDELAPERRGLPPRLSFRGDLYRGDASGSGSLLVRDIGVRVRRVLYKDGAPPGWFLFGNERELFAVRFAPGPALMQVWLTYGIPGADEARAVQRGSVLTLPESEDARELEGEVTAEGRHYQVGVRKLAVLYGD